MKIVLPLSERDVANALGLLCIANEVTAEARAAALAAFRGPVDTSDEGRRVYYEGSYSRMGKSSAITL